MIKIPAITLFSLLALSVPAAGHTAEAKTAPVVGASAGASVAASTDDTKAQKRVAAGYPFRGILGAVDKDKLTITVTTKNSKRVLQLSKQAKFTKNGKPAKLTEGVIGEEVAGYVKKLEEGKEEVTSVRFGPKPAEDAKPKPVAEPKPSPKAAGSDG